MIRQKARSLFATETRRLAMIKVFRVVGLIGLLWILCFPQISQEVFTSENAFDGHYMKSNFLDNPKLNRYFD